MRVELKTEKNVPYRSASGETKSGTEYRVLLISRRLEVVVDSFMSPGTFLTGYLSEHQAKVRAAERVESVRSFLIEAGEMEEVPPPNQPVRTVTQPRTAGRPAEERSFIPAMRA